MASCEAFDCLTVQLRKSWNTYCMAIHMCVYQCSLNISHGINVNKYYKPYIVINNRQYMYYTGQIVALSYDGCYWQSRNFLRFRSTRVQPYHHFTQCTILSYNVCLWLVTDLWLSPCTPVFSINMTVMIYIVTDILLLIVALNIHKP